NVTVNDLFLAAVAQAAFRFVPTKQTSRRHDLALGTIVDLRGRTNGKLAEDFGLFLGFTNVILRPNDFNDSARLVQHIATQTRLQKELAVPESSMIRMTAGVAVGSLLGSRRIKNFYRKRIPLAGGISNVNLNRTWAGRYHPWPL